jgi:hypothetical protein
MAGPLWSESANTEISFGRDGRLVTPHNSTNLDPIGKSVVVTDITAGANLSIVTEKGTTIPFVGVSVGFIPPYRVKRVNSTGTTITACYTID